MPEIKVISDSSPLIALSRISSFHFLKELFGKIYIPQAVYQEVVTQGKGRPGTKETKEAHWIETLQLKNNLLSLQLQKRLKFGSGECETIALAQELKADWCLCSAQLICRGFCVQFG